MLGTRFCVPNVGISGGSLCRKPIVQLILCILTQRKMYQNSKGELLVTKNEEGHSIICS